MIRQPTARMPSTFTVFLVSRNPNRDVTINWASDNSAAFFLNNDLMPRQSTGTLGFQSLSSFTFPNPAPSAWSASDFLVSVR